MPSRKLQQTTQLRNVEQMMPQIVTTRSLLGVEIVWPSLLHGMFAAVL